MFIPDDILETLKLLPYTGVIIFAERDRDDTEIECLWCRGCEAKISVDYNAEPTPGDYGRYETLPNGNRRFRITDEERERYQRAHETWLQNCFLNRATGHKAACPFLRARAWALEYEQQEVGLHDNDLMEVPT